MFPEVAHKRHKHVCMGVYYSFMLVWLVRNLTHSSQSSCFSRASLHISLSPSFLSSCEVTEATGSPEWVIPQLGYAHQGAACCWSSAAAAKLFSIRRPLSYCGHSQEGSQSLLTVEQHIEEAIQKETEMGAEM